MAIESKDIGNNFSDDQKELIALYEKQINDQIKKYYVEGKKISVQPEPYPNYDWKGEIPVGEDEKVINEILRKYREAGWLIEWVFEETSVIDGDWIFTLKKISDYTEFDFIGKSLKISFPFKERQGETAHHSLIVPILGVCNTKVTTPELLEDNIEYLNFCIPANFYINEGELIRFIRYYKNGYDGKQSWAIFTYETPSPARFETISKRNNLKYWEDIVIDKDLKVEVI